VAYRVTLEYNQGSALNAKQVLNFKLDHLSNDSAVRDDPAGGTVRHISLAVDAADQTKAEAEARGVIRDALDVGDDELTTVQIDLLGTVEQGPPVAGDTNPPADDNIIDAEVVEVEDDHGQRNTR
jgi:hypothetical protein